MYLHERGHEVTDIAISYDEALASISNQKPDLLLIDIKLYGQKSGVDLAIKLSDKEYNLPFIFLTSQIDDRILGIAINTNPKGYLVKPIQKESLWSTIEVALQQLKVSKDHVKIKVVDGNKSHFITMKDILYIEVDHIYITIHSISKIPLNLRLSLKEILALLNGDKFIQCHRSYIINSEYIENYNGNTLTINNKVIPISRTFKNEIKAKISE